MINLETYRHTIFPQVVEWRKRRPDESINDAASNLALSTSCPILVICYYIQELEGESVELSKLISSLKRFYHE